MVSGERCVVSGEWLAVSGEWLVVSGEWANFVNLSSLIVNR